MASTYGLTGAAAAKRVALSLGIKTASGIPGAILTSDPIAVLFSLPSDGVASAAMMWDTIIANLVESVYGLGGTRPTSRDG